MHFTSLLGEVRSDMQTIGWEVDPDKKHNWSAMMERVNGHVRSLNFGYKG